MIIQCQKCGRDVSDESLTCWNCDAPIVLGQKPPQTTGATRPKSSYVNLANGIRPDQIKDYLTIPPVDIKEARFEASKLVEQLKNLLRNRRAYYNGCSGYTVMNRSMALHVKGNPDEQSRLYQMDKLRELIIKRLTLILDNYEITEKELPSEYHRCSFCGHMVPWCDVGRCPRCGRPVFNDLDIDEKELNERMKWRVLGYQFEKWS